MLCEAHPDTRMHAQVTLEMLFLVLRALRLYSKWKTYSSLTSPASGSPTLKQCSRYSIHPSECQGQVALAPESLVSESLKTGMTAFAPTCSAVPCSVLTHKDAQKETERRERGDGCTSLGHLASLGDWEPILLSPLTSYGHGSARLHSARNRGAGTRSAVSLLGLCKG